MDKYNFKDEEDMSKREVAGTMMEAVEKHLKDMTLLLSQTSFTQYKKRVTTGNRLER